MDRIMSQIPDEMFCRSMLGQEEDAGLGSGIDDRQPYATFDLPIGGGEGSNTYGILLPKMELWNHLGQAMFLMTAFAAAMSLVVRNLVVKRRGSVLSYVVGSAVVVACILFPYVAIAAFNVQNLVVKFTLSCGPALYMFRTTEAMFGFSPPGVESSALSYGTYYSLPMELSLDRKTARPELATRDEISTNLTVLALNVLRMSALMSAFSPYAFEPFADARPGGSSSLLDYLTPGHLGNCFVAAYLFQQSLGLSGFAITAAVHLTSGYRTVVSMKNPLLEATSPSDFWGRRWNVLVHGVLKRGVYKPVRKYSVPLLASLAAFVASGCFHEWMVHVISYRRQCSPSCYDPVHGSNLAFFAWNGVIIALEMALGRVALFQTVGRALPRFAVTFLVVMTSLPVAHWFADPYIRMGFFNHYQIGFPLLVKVP